MQSDEKLLKEVRGWLDEHVKVINPKRIELFAFEVDWETFSGSFSIKFDSEVLEDRLDFGLNASGRVDYYLPIFHSPLGVPASYPAIEISNEVREAIAKGLGEIFPRLKAAGIDRETGEEIAYFTPPKERVDHKILQNAIYRVNKEFSKVIFMGKSGARIVESPNKIKWTHTVNILIGIGKDPALVSEYSQMIKDRFYSWPDWNIWNGLTEHLSMEEHEYLGKGFAYWSLENPCNGGSVSPLIGIYRLYAEKYPQAAKSFANWIIEHSDNQYVPYGYTLKRK